MSNPLAWRQTMTDLTPAEAENRAGCNFSTTSSLSHENTQDERRPRQRLKGLNRSECRSDVDNNMTHETKIYLDLLRKPLDGCALLPTPNADYSRGPWILCVWYETFDVLHVRTGTVGRPGDTDKGVWAEIAGARYYVQTRLAHCPGKG